MRTLSIATTGLLLATAVACESGPGPGREPPLLEVTSPQRAHVQRGTGQLTVTGTVAPSELGHAIEKVYVNNVPAVVGADGAFVATVNVMPGATLIHTVARDASGMEATDTRAVHAGELRPHGANIDRAVAAAISTEAFAKIAAAAGPIIKGLDMGAMLAPMNPMVRSGDEQGEDCLFGRVFIDDIKFSDIRITLVPTIGGLRFNAQIDGLDVPGRARYAVACVTGNNNVRVRATRVIVGGTLLVTPNGMAGFKTTLDRPTVQITGLDIQASGIPGTIIDMLSLDTAIQGVIARGAERAMEPMLSSALGALGGPKQLNVLGKTITMQVEPAEIEFDRDGGYVTMSTRVLVGGAEGGKGYIYTPNGAPALYPASGFQLGLADDLANDMLAQVQAIGMLDLSQHAPGGTFDNVDVRLTLPPMISADPADGSLRVVLGDVGVTFTNAGRPVGKAAVNARVDVAIEPSADGYGIAVKLGKPEIHVDIVDDVANLTLFEDAHLAKMMEVVLGAQLGSISQLLSGIPLPQVAGLQVRDLSVGSDDGYLIVKGAFD